jgi:hypothetical protein
MELDKENPKIRRISVILTKLLPFTGQVVTYFDDAINNVVGFRLMAITTSRTIGTGGSAQNYWMLRCAELGDSCEKEHYTNGVRYSAICGITDRALMSTGGGLLTPKSQPYRLSLRHITKLTWDVVNSDLAALQYTGTDPEIGIYLELYASVP